MVHQCVSESIWFRTMLGIDVAAPPLPQQETRVEFIKRYAYTTLPGLLDGEAGAVPSHRFRPVATPPSPSDRARSARGPNQM